MTSELTRKDDTSKRLLRIARECKLVRKNGCILADCVVELPCPNKHPPKTGDGFCVSWDNGTKRNAIEQKSKVTT